ncbi:hypothetical protein BHE74_00059209 [Ensete ventricosum]|nr:hypothetical protein BHE74_00059209 [Ensete ventricosum]
MQWDLAESSLGDSPKESGSTLGTLSEITGKKIVRLAARLPKVVGVCGRFDLHPKKEDLKVDVGRWRRTTIKL